MKTLREKAQETVLRVRGSYDAPGFEICVLAELRRLEARQAKWKCPISYAGCTGNCGNYGCGN